MADGLRIVTERSASLVIVLIALEREGKLTGAEDIADGVITTPRAGEEFKALLGEMDSARKFFFTDAGAAEAHEWGLDPKAPGAVHLYVLLAAESREDLPRLLNDEAKAGLGMLLDELIEKKEREEREREER